MSDEAIKTVAGEITKIAVEHGYNGAAPKTITGAIDALADTLAGSDVDSGQTVAQAVRALAPYIGSGGGGGSLGALVPFPFYDTNVPVVGASSKGDDLSMEKLLIGSQVVTDSSSSEVQPYLDNIATGATIMVRVPYGPDEDDARTCEAYAVTMEDTQYLTVRKLDIVYTAEENSQIEITMPELEDGEALCLHPIQ